MALQKREKVLATTTGVLLVVLMAVWLVVGGKSPATLRKEHENLLEIVAEKQRKSSPLVQATKELRRREQRSLPTHPQAARALYKQWLLETIVDGVKFSNANISPKAGTSRPGIYTGLKFTVEMNGTLEKLTRFLHEFYSASHLHKISSLSINPIDGSPEFKLDVTIEALMLPGADRRNKLSTEPGNRLELSSLQEYQDVILSRKMDENRVDRPAAYTARGLFASYAPPPEPKRVRKPEPERVREPEPPPPVFDLTKYTYVTAMISVDGKSEAWLEIRPTGETKKVKEGEQFEIGKVRCKILRIGNRQVEITLDGEHRLVGFQESLRDGLTLPD